MDLVGQGSSSSMDSFASWKLNGNGMEKEEREETPLQGEDKSNVIFLLCTSFLSIHLHNLFSFETSIRAGNVDVYGFLEPQSIQRSGQSQFEFESYIKNWMPT